jgi:hypothetical protein
MNSTVRVLCLFCFTRMCLKNVDTRFPGSLSRWLRGLRRGSRPLVCWDCRFESPRGGWIFFCCECCVLSGRSLRLADHSSIGVLLSLVCLSVITKPRKWDDPVLLGADAPCKNNNKRQFFQLNYQFCISIRKKFINFVLFLTACNALTGRSLFLTSSWIQFLYIIVLPKYLNSATFSHDLIW